MKFPPSIWERMPCGAHVRRHVLWRGELATEYHPKHCDACSHALFQRQIRALRRARQ